MNKYYFVFLFLSTLLFSCENEPIGELQYTTDYIEQDATLYTFLHDVTDEESDSNIGCIDFNYPLALFVFDENYEFVEAVGIDDDVEFLALLGNLAPGYTISLSYPISGSNGSGAIFVVTTNEELFEVIESCVKEEELTECNGALCQEGTECQWRIASYDNSDIDLVGDYFNANLDGSVGFYKDATYHFGSWSTYFIDDSLHLNLNYVGNGALQDALNHDWKVLSFSFEQMTLQFEANTLVLQRECELPCESEFFEECELETGNEIAFFDLKDYINCLGLTSSASNYTAPIEFSFYQTLIEAQNGNNPLPIENYMNIENPQVIFYKQKDTETGEETGYGQMVLKAVPCIVD